MASIKKPAFQFYPGDWMKDTNLRRCSLAAKGAWIELICLAHEAQERGKFTTNGKPWPLDDLCSALCGDLSVNLCAIQELLDKGVLKQGEAGEFFIDRIVRDERKSALCSEAGKAGGGNPEWKHKGDDKGHCKGGHKGTPKRNAKASSSSSSSSSELLSTYVESNSGAVWMLEGDFCEWWGRWIEDRKARKKPLTANAASLQLAKLESWGPSRAVAAIKLSIERQWQGIYEGSATGSPGALNAIGDEAKRDEAYRTFFGEEPPRG